MEKQDFPAWYYGPEGNSQICNTADEIPAGWHDHPSKVIMTPEKTGTKPIAPKIAENAGAQTGTKPIVPPPSPPAGNTARTNEVSDQSNTLDADGWPFDGAMHAATQSFTSKGVWRMKVGVARPAPKEGFPKPPLDL